MSLLRRFSGGVGLGTVSISNHDITDADEQPNTDGINPRCVCAFTLGSTGIASYSVNLQVIGNYSGNYINEWLLGYRGRPSAFSAKATTIIQQSAGPVITGGAFQGITGSWIALGSSDVSWSATSRGTAIDIGTELNFNDGSAYWQFTLQIAKTSDTSTILDSATITLASAAMWTG